MSTDAQSIPEEPLEEPPRRRRQVQAHHVRGEDEHDQEHLDHEGAEAVERRRSRRRRRSGHRRVARTGPARPGGRRSWAPRGETNWTPYWSISTGQNRISFSVAPIVENACGTCESGDRIRAASSHPQSALPELIDDGVDADVGEGRDERVGEEPDHRELEERTPRDALQRLEGRDLAVRALRDVLAQLLEIEVLVVQGLSRIEFERGRLQEREDLGEAVVADHVGCGGDRAVGVGQQRRGHEQLCPVGTERTRAGGHLGGTEVGERRRAVGPHEQGLGVHLSVRDAEVVEAVQDLARCPEAARRRPRPHRASPGSEHSRRARGARRPGPSPPPPRPTSRGHHPARRPTSGTLRARPARGGRP